MEENTNIQTTNDADIKENKIQENWKQIVQKMDRYSNFTLVEEPKPFKEMFKNQDIAIVQLHSTQIYDTSGIKYITGFCGMFEWQDNEAIPLDGDSYSSDALVLGYEWFKSESGKTCIEILVGNDW